MLKCPGECTVNSRNGLWENIYDYQRTTGLNILGGPKSGGVKGPESFIVYPLRAAIMQ